MIGHVLKRILMVLVGYLVAVLAGLIAVVVIYAILSSLPNAPGYFRLMEFTPVALLVVPPLGMFVYFLTIISDGDADAGLRLDRGVLFAAQLLAAHAVRRRRRGCRFHFGMA